MTTQLETTGSLGRSLKLSVATAALEKEVGQRLRKLARTVKMPGFRPGKVPMKMIEQSYGPQVHAEVLGDAVSKAFTESVQEHKLRVAGQPHDRAARGRARRRARLHARASRSTPK